MKIVLTTHDDHYLVVLDVSEDLELINFKALCEVETGIPSQNAGLTHNGQLLVDDFSTMKNLGVHDGDVIVIQRVSGNSNNEMDHAFNNPNSSTHIPVVVRFVTDVHTYLPIICLFRHCAAIGLQSYSGARSFQQ